MQATSKVDAVVVRIKYNSKTVFLKDLLRMFLCIRCTRGRWSFTRVLR